MPRIRTLLALGVLAAGVLGCDSAERDDTGEIVSAGSVSAFAIRVGDCFNAPTGDEFASLDAVPCDETHDAQVYTAFDYPAEDDDGFPGIDAFETYAADPCLADFERFVGIAFEDSRYDVRTMYPTDLSWQKGDREILCFLVDLRLRPLVGTAQGSAQ